MATEAQTCVDEEISKQIVSLCNLRTQRNALARISRLPAEILATIFIHCARNHHQRTFIFHAIPSIIPCWVSVSYVCRRWRDVALGCPLLWSYIFVTSRRWTEVLLARSKQSSLKVRVWFEHGTNSEWHLLEQVMNHVERIQDLCLFQVPDHFADKFLSRAPRLQNLKIQSNPCLSGPPFVLFHGDTPALRTLELSHCSVSWPLFTLCSLTTLSLSYIPTSAQLDMTKFLAALSSMEAIVHLYLDRALPSAASFLDSPAFHQRVGLPHLTRLLVVAPLSTITALVSCIITPSNTEFRLKFDSGAEDEFFDDPSILCSTLAEKFDTSEDLVPSSFTIRSLIIEYVNWREMGLTFSGSERDFDSFRSTDYPEWDCSIPLKIVVDCDLLVNSFCCSIAFTNIQSLHVIDPVFGLSFWLQALVYLRNLRYLKLSNGNMPDITPVLSLLDPTTYDDIKDQCGHGLSNQDENHILSPKLEQLELWAITFLPEGGAAAASMDEPEITQRHLMDALSTRNFPQGLLIMTECNINKMESEFDETWSWDGHLISSNYSE